MAGNDEFILGNEKLHAQLALALTVMTQLICNASRPPTLAALCDTIGVQPRAMRQLVRMLCDGGLVGPHEQLADTWICLRAPHAVSMADLYRCVAAATVECRGESRRALRTDGPGAAELLMMQTTVAINQIVVQYLQRFDLGRLRIAESALMLSASLRRREDRDSAHEL